jgi:hypothetical protein
MTLLFKEEQPLQPQLLFMSACGWMDALQPEGWLDLLQAAGARWRLVFTAGGQQEQQPEGYRIAFDTASDTASSCEEHA